MRAHARVSTILAVLLLASLAPLATADWEDACAGGASDAGNDFANATALAIPGSCVGWLAPQYDRDYYRVQVDVGQVLTAILPPAADDLDASVCVFSPTGANQGCGFGMPDWTKTATAVARAGGAWRIGLVTHFGTTGQYTLRTDLHGERATDGADDCGTGAGAGNAPTGATVVAAPADCAGAIAGSDRLDYYAIHVREGQSVFVNATPDGAPLELCALEGATDHVRACDRDASDGALTVAVDPVGATDLYRFRLQRLEGDATYGLTAVVVGEPVNEAPRLRLLGCTSPVYVGQETTCSFAADDDSTGVAFDLDWGDGASVRVPAAGHVAPGETQTATHAYASAGTKSPRIVATDDADPPRQSYATSMWLYVRNVPLGQADCGTDGDAGDWWDEPRALALPKALCAGRIVASNHTDPADWYAVEVPEGGALHLQAIGDARMQVTAYAPGRRPDVHAPTGATDWWNNRTELHLASSVAGTWLIGVEEDWWEEGLRSYELSIATKRSSWNGTLLLPTGGALAAQTGPGAAEGIDGAWVDLGLVATGAESASATDGALVRWFAGETELGATSGGYAWTRVPAGATRALVATSDPLRAPFSWTLHVHH